MAFYNVNAVSIAVIKDYKVEWVKIYGCRCVREKISYTSNVISGWFY
ncbi:hypothetical protein [Chryseobacterium sp. JK1]